jgi:hypothetical protein
MKWRRHWHLLLLIGLTMGLTLSGCLGIQPQSLPPQVTVQDQAIVNSQVTITQVVIPQDGWVTIYRNQAGQMGEQKSMDSALSRFVSPLLTSVE